MPETTLELPFNGQEPTFDELIKEGALRILNHNLVNADRVQHSHTRDQRLVDKIILFRAEEGTTFDVIRRGIRRNGCAPLDAWKLLRLLALYKDLNLVVALASYTKNHDAKLVLGVQKAEGHRYLKAFPGNNVGLGKQRSKGIDLYAGCEIAS